MSQFPTRGGNGDRPILMSDQQGFDRRWFAPNLKAVYAPTQPEQVAVCVTDALSNLWQGCEGHVWPSLL